MPRRPRCGTRRATAALCLAAAFSGTSAAAQTITLPQVVDRDQPLRPTSQNPEWISRADCTADDRFHFDLSLDGWGSSGLEVWAGTVDCTPYDVRNGSSPQCWQVLPRLTVTNARPTISLRARDIVAQRKGSYVEAGPEACTASTATSEPQSVSLYFLFVDSAGQAVVLTRPAVYTRIKYDLVGPDAPTEVRVGSGEERLVVRFEGSTAVDRAGYRFYCDDGTTAADAGSAEAGTGDAASPEGGTSSDGGCPSALLIPGTVPPEEAFCGSVQTGGKGEARGLVNGTTYAVGVAAIDGVGNVGPLSLTACGTPRPVSDFFEAYRDAGGRGGGGFCAVVSGAGRAGRGSRGTAFVLLGAAAWLLVRRRRA